MQSSGSGQHTTSCSELSPLEGKGKKRIKREEESDRSVTFSTTWLVAVETHLTKQLHEEKEDI